ncbi:mitochondrial carrier domain-containing protein [Chytriomyces sp. MP71]|nr:mitochondrial carrier domain-containing protein [Chytriomyces sp. MP71]
MEVAHLNPSSEETTGADKPDAKAGVIAGFARTAAFQMSMLLTGFGKGLLKWWFRMPVKLFRPYAVNPYMVFQHMAAEDGKQANVKYIRGVVRQEGLSVLGRNMLPLMLVNSTIGAFLFNAYAWATHILYDVQGNFSVLEDGSRHYATSQIQIIDPVPFIGGAFAGAAQSLLSTPVDNLQRQLDPASIAAQRHSKGGIISLLVDTARNLLAEQPPPKPIQQQENPHPSPTHYSHRVHHLKHQFNHRLSPLLLLYQNFRVSCFKDSLGFALFFGFFENGRDFGKGLVKQFQEWQGTTREGNPIMKGVTITGPQALAVVAAGGLAGMGFQAVSYPVDRLQAEAMGRRGAGHPRESWWHTYRRIGGFREVYRGIGGQFVRVVPASAVGLFVFEIVNEYLGP